MPELPSGTVTFLFTDIEGSTRLLQALGSAYPPMLEEHRRRIRDAFAAGDGVEVSTEGDSIFAVFRDAGAAVGAAAAAQRSLARPGWPTDTQIRVRMGLHTGEGWLSAGDYVGLDIHRASRISSAANGGQVLLSDTTRALVEGSLPAGVTMRDLGHHRLKDLAHPERLAQLVIDGLPSDFGPLHSLGPRATNLPIALTSFIGREAELASLRDLLRTSRIVTLTGPGGVGKTRLAQQLATTVADEFADGVVFVDLAAITDPLLVEPTIATVLGLRGQDARPLRERLLEYLSDRQLLVILDNLEQLLAVSKSLVELVEASTRLTLLVTSRAPLRVRGEQAIRVPPLRVPDMSRPDAADLAAYESVALFIDRARASRSDYSLSADDPSAVGELVARLDGLPLAIELAAARVDLLPPRTLLEQLRTRSGLFAQGARDLPERQRTLQATIAWSHDLLQPPEQRVFAHLAVFVGGADLEAAQRVGGALGDAGGELLDHIASLIDSSLVLRTEGIGGEPRLRMLETIREFARGRLAEDPRRAQVEEAHAGYYLALADEARPGLEGGDPPRWLDRLEQEHDNLRAALRWAIDENDGDIAQRLLAALWRFWHLRGHVQEGRRWADEILAMPSARARDAIRARAVLAAGGLAYWQEDLSSAGRHYEESLAISREIADRWGEAEALRNQAWVLFASGDPERAAGAFERSGAIFGELDDRRGLAEVAFGRAMRPWLSDDLEAADRLFGEALRLYEALGDAFWMATSHHALGQVDRVAGRYPDAVTHYGIAIGIFRRLGDVSGVAMEVDLIGAAQLDRGDPERAVRLAAAAAALRESIAAGAPRSLLRYVSALESARPLVSPAAYEAAVAAGRALELDEIVALALEPG